MSVKRYTGTFKVRDDVFDNITPNNVVQAPSGGVSSPAGEWKPAAWLPIVWTGDSSDDSFVISSGKVVSLDAEGRVCPSGYRHNDRCTVAGTWVTYVAADVSAGVIDVTTGDAVTAAVAYTGAQVATGLLSRGAVVTDEISGSLTTAGSYDSTDVADVRAVIGAFISPPVGVCAYDVYCWAGDQFEDNVLTGASAGLNFHNYQKQHLVQFFTDVQMKVPNLTHAAATGLDLSDDASLNDWSGDGSNTDGVEFPDAGTASAAALTLTPALLASLSRYDGVITATSTVFGWQLANSPLAANNALSLWAESDSDVAALYFLNEKDAPAKLSAAGDYFIDVDAGILLSYSADGANPITTGNSGSLTYYYYTATAFDDSDVMDRMIHIDGIIHPGQHITFDANSNFIPVTVAAATVMSTVLGRVLAVIKEPKGLLDRVETAFSGSSFSASAQMPGTATSGLSDLLTLSPEDVSDQVAILNIKVQ